MTYRVLLTKLDPVDQLSADFELPSTMGLGFKLIVATSKTDLSVQYAFSNVSSEPLRSAGFIRLWKVEVTNSCRP